MQTQTPDVSALAPVAEWTPPPSSAATHAQDAATTHATSAPDVPSVAAPRYAQDVSAAVQRVLAWHRDRSLHH